MVEETIKAIRETEAAADVIVKEAGEKSQKILEDARQEAERMIKSQEESLQYMLSPPVLSRDFHGNSHQTKSVYRFP